MKYKESLIHITNLLESSAEMYSLILLRAKGLSMTLSGVRCFLDGSYLLCLSIDDIIEVHSGFYEATAIRFMPGFYNVNLTHSLIRKPIYQDMRTRYGYPDFHLFHERDHAFCGILPLSNDEYEIARLHFLCAKQHIDGHRTDGMWSCHTRSDMISILRIAEGAYSGNASGEDNEIIRYIREHLDRELTLASLCLHLNTNRTTLAQRIKALTGMSPMQYILTERLNQSRPDLLFTEVSVADIAKKYGFSNENYYIRAFKKHFGTTPLQYRRDGVAERIRNQEKYREHSK